MVLSGDIHLKTQGHNVSQSVCWPLTLIMAAAERELIKVIQDVKPPLKNEYKCVMENFHHQHQSLLTHHKHTHTHVQYID